MMDSIYDLEFDKPKYPKLSDFESHRIKNFKNKNFNKEELENLLKDAFYGISVNEETIFNPLINMPTMAADDFSKYLVYLMSKPEYFYFIIKHVFLMDSFPFQCLILRELFNHRFPLIIASRGASKCEVGDSMVVMGDGIHEIKDLVPEEIEQKQQYCNKQAFGETGYRDVEYSFYNGIKRTKRIITKSGRQLEGTLNHPIRVLRDGKIQWIEIGDLSIGDFTVVQRGVKEWESNTLDPQVAYMIGAMVGDGCYSEKSSCLGFTNKDQQSIDLVNKGLKKWNDSELDQMRCNTRERIQYTAKAVNKMNTQIKKDFIKDFQCNIYSAKTFKTTPKIIFGASFKAIQKYIQGLFDTDGCCPARSPLVELSSKSPKLIEETQMLLICLGIASSIKKQWNKKYQKYYYKLQVAGPSLREFNKQIGFGISYKQKQLDKHCSRACNSNLDIIPKEYIKDLILETKKELQIKFKGHGHNYERSLLTNSRLSTYDISYDKLNKLIEIFETSPISSDCESLNKLKKIAENYYYFDKITDILDSENKTYDIHINDNDHSFVSNGFITHNTSSLGMYLLISLIVRPEIKIVITGAGFRQAKLVFEVMENIWDKSPVLQSCYPGKHNGPKHGTDAWTFRLGNSICYALPVGPDGSKVRGYRANILLCVHKETLIQTDRGLVEISKYLEHDCFEVMNKEGNLELPDKIFKTQKQDVYEIKTKNGYKLKCSGHHKVWTTDGKNADWKLGKDLNLDDYLELDQNDYFPEDYITKNGLVVDEKIGYLLGVLVSEGHVNNRHQITITQNNKKFLEEIELLYPEFNWSYDFKPAHTDKRGWKINDCWDLRFCDTEFRTNLYKLGLDYSIHRDKCIPWCILQSPRSVVIEFLKGLFIGDGSCFSYKDNTGKKTKIRGAISYYSASEKLIEQLQIVLLKFGVIGCNIKRKSKISKNPNYVLKIADRTLFILHDLIKNAYWDDTIDSLFKVESLKKFRKKGNSYICEGTRCDKTIYIGSFKTEEECKDAYLDWLKSTKPAMRVKSVTKLDEQETLYDFVMPETHSFIGNGIINHNCDEFASVNRTVFEEVMSGFLAVSADPMEEIKQNARTKLLKHISPEDKRHLKSKEFNDPYKLKNQLILSGTAYYKHNHFYSYYNKWREIISTGGDHDKLRDIVGSDFNPDNFNWEDYSLMRVPIALTTTGFMDMAQINRIKSSTTSDVYAREYDTIFSDDSNGFYRRSLIDACTVSDLNEIVKQNTEGELEPVKFGATLYGDINKKYVYGVDPAYEGDNFAIVILECETNYRKVVHVWTTQATDHKQLLKDGVITENDYYHYAARKIRQLMIRFPCAYIAIDSQGGGKAVMEALRDDSKLETNERMILPYVDPSKPPKDTDSMEGDHIVYEIKPSSDWNIDANHSLKKDMEMKDVLFPSHDGITYSEAEFYDEALGVHATLNDTLEDCIFNIEELKNELTMIAVTETSTGKQRFDTPELKIGISKKGRLKKDRYSAFLMANYVARNQDVLIPRRITGELFSQGGFAKSSVFITGNKSVGNLNIANKFEKMYESQMSDKQN